MERQVSSLSTIITEQAVLNRKRHFHPLDVSLKGHIYFMCPSHPLAHSTTSIYSTLIKLMRTCTETNGLAQILDFKDDIFHFVKLQQHYRLYTKNKSTEKLPAFALWCTTQFRRYLLKKKNPSLLSIVTNSQDWKMCYALVNRFNLRFNNKLQ